MNTHEPITHRKSGTTQRVLKMMSIFGSLQVVSILCSMVRVKLVALWIGAAGIGLYGIFNSALDMISNATQLGLRSSAVRDLAAAPRSRLGALIQSVRRWGWLLGMAGAMITLALAVPLSRYAFADTNHAWWFALLAAAVMFQALASADGAVFQGLKELKRLARGSMWGVLGGLAVSVPMYRFWGIDSIVPSIVAYGLCTWLGMRVCRTPDEPEAEKMPLSASLRLGGGFIRLGAYLTTCEFLTALVTFIFMGWLNARAGETETGFFQAGFTIANRYVGLVFTVIALEFYPRLSGVAHSRRRMSLFVSHETGLVTLVMIPVATIFLAADQWIVRLLYKGDFLVILPFLSWAIVGTLLRALSWCMSFTMLARGDGRTYLLTESLSCAVYLAANILFYNGYGITGSGIAYAVWYAAYTVIVGVVYFRRYGLRLSRAAVALTVSALAIVGVAAALRLTCGWVWTGALALAATLWAARQLKVSFLKGGGGLRALFRG